MELELLPYFDDKAYNLVLAIDILEHFEKAQGIAFLKECQRVSRGSVLVSTPKDFVAQEALANPLENLRSHWTEEDFRLLVLVPFYPTR